MLNWTFMFASCELYNSLSDYRWVSLAVILGSTSTALQFCYHINSSINEYIVSTPKPLQSARDDFSNLKLACRCTYAGLAFGFCAW